MNPFIYSTTGAVSHKTLPGIRLVVDGVQIDLYWIVVHLKAFFLPLAKHEWGWSRDQADCFKKGGVVWLKAGELGD